MPVGEDIFGSTPAQWGLRGDPEIWGRMQLDFGARIDAVATEGEARALLLDCWRVATGCELTDPGLPDVLAVQGLRLEGMSGGLVAVPLWRSRLMPLLEARLRESWREDEG